MSQNQFRPYSDIELPSGFKYPKSYLNLSMNLNDINNIPYFSWWFSDTEEPLSEHMNIYFNLTGRQNLIEFARDGDWAACFDAMDHSGNPKVLVYDLGNKENFYEKNNFEEWLEFVKENY